MEISYQVSYVLDFSLSFHFKINCNQYEKNTLNHTLMFPHFFSEYHVSLHFHLKFEKKMKKFFPALVAVPPTTLYSFCKGYGFADSHKVSGNPSSHILCGNGILLEIWPHAHFNLYIFKPII